MQGFSDGIFWDVDRDHIDLSLHAPFGVQQVLVYGQIGNWILLPISTKIVCIAVTLSFQVRRQTINLSFDSTTDAINFVLIV